MTYDSILFWMMAICVIFILIFIFSRQLIYIVRAVINGVVGICGMFVINLLTAGFGLNVGINVMTVLITAILGLPGLVSLYILKIVL